MVSNVKENYNKMVNTLLTESISLEYDSDSFQLFRIWEYNKDGKSLIDEICTFNGVCLGGIDIPKDIYGDMKDSGYEHFYTRDKGNLSVKFYVLPEYKDNFSVNAEGYVCYKGNDIEAD